MAVVIWTLTIGFFVCFLLEVVLIVFDLWLGSRELFIHHFATDYVLKEPLMIELSSNFAVVFRPC